MYSHIHLTPFVRQGVIYLCLCIPAALVLWSLDAPLGALVPVGWCVVLLGIALASGLHFGDAEDYARDE